VEEKESHCEVGYGRSGVADVRVEIVVW